MAVVQDRSDGSESARPSRDPSSDLSARRVTLEPWGVQVGPLGHLAAERARLGQLRFEHFDVRPQGATIGAVVEGLDLCGPLGRRGGGRTARRPPRVQGPVLP